MANYIGLYKVWLCTQLGRILYQSYLTVFSDVHKTYNRVSAQMLSKDPITVFAVRNPSILARFHSEFCLTGLQGKSLMLTHYLLSAMLTTQAFLLFTCCPNIAA